MQQILDLLRGLLNIVVRYKPSDGLEASCRFNVVCMSYYHFLSPLLSRKASWLGSRPRKFFNMSEASWKKEKQKKAITWYYKESATRPSSNWTKTLYQDYLHHIAKDLCECIKELQWSNSRYPLFFTFSYTITFPKDLAKFQSITIYRIHVF